MGLSSTSFLNLIVKLSSGIATEVFALKIEVCYDERSCYQGLAVILR